MLRKKFTAVAMSAVLAVSLCPGLAVAAPLTGGSVATPAKTTQTVKTQAKKTVYVLTDYQPTSYSYTKYKSDGTAVSHSGTISAPTDSTTQTDTWTYNTKTGLLTSDGSWDFKYKGVNLKSATEYVSPESIAAGYVDNYPEKYAFTSKKGLVKSATYTKKYVGTDTTVKRADSKETVKYTYDKKGNLTKSATTNYRYNLGNKYYNKLKKYSTNTATFTLNKKGLPSKSIATTKYYDKSTYTSETTKYTYDKKKNLKKATAPYSDTTTYKYSGYKNGVPTKLTITSKETKQISTSTVDKVVTETSSKTYALTYTKLKVSKANAAVAKRQQWALLNGTALNGAFGNAPVKTMHGAGSMYYDDYYYQQMNDYYYYYDED